MSISSQVSGTAAKGDYNGSRIVVAWTAPTVGGFTTDDERDAAMTMASDADIAWVRPGRKNPGRQKIWHEEISCKMFPSVV